MPPLGSSQRSLRVVLGAACLLTPVAAATAFAEPTTPAPTGGGATFEPPPPPPEKATLVNGRVIAPVSAPTRVKRVIEAANQLVEKPYVYGGGHKPYSSRLDRGYDCSGSVSYALHAGDLLDSSLVSGAFARWGDTGRGSWISIYANASHVYMVVAGMRFDTSARSQSGSRWTTAMRSPSGYVVTHPTGL